MKNTENKNPYIFIRGLKRVDHTVFCVQDGQKYYIDKAFGKTLRVPYASGQQVKRSVIHSFLSELDRVDAPTTFFFDVKTNDGKKSLGEGEVLSVCNPNYPDQLIGGWMYTPKGGKERAVKRRSPLSISALKALHPLLVGYSTENITFDRTDKPEVHKVVVRDENGNELSNSDIEELLQNSDRSLRRKWIPNKNGSNARASGLFIYDIVIDLRTLFCVSTDIHERELKETTLNDEKTIDKLKSIGWTEGKNIFGNCLVCPKDDIKDNEGNIIQLGRTSIIKALAKSIINWRITSNQARTLSIQETLALAISDNANRLASAIRAKLVQEDNENTDAIAKPIIEDKWEDVYVSLPCAGYVVTEQEQADALDKAEEQLIKLMMAFDYEKQ